MQAVTSRGKLVGWALLATSLSYVVSACASEEKPPFYDARRDGGVDSDAGGMAGESGGSSSGGPSSGGSSSDGFLGQSGDPSIFDPEQVYLRGAYVAENLNMTDAFASGCSDVSTAIPDWSSPLDDLETPRGVTAATTCETYQYVVRIDGTITYTIAFRAGRLFFEDDFDVDGGTLVFHMANQRPHDNDIQIFDCLPNRGPLRQWLDPETGTTIHTCWDPPDDAPVVRHLFAGTMETLDVPSGYIITHLGIAGYALLQKLDAPAEMAVWNRDDDSMVELQLDAFRYENIYAVRATPTGFLMLVVDSPDPAALSRWEIEYDGALVGPLAPPFVAPNHRLDNSHCGRAPFGTPEDKVPNYLPDRGCMCALEETEAAVCIVEDARGDEHPQLVIRFDPDGSDPEVVFDPADDDIITEVVGLVTGE